MMDFCLSAGCVFRVCCLIRWGKDILKTREETMKDLSTKKFEKFVKSKIEIFEKTKNSSFKSSFKEVSA